MLRILIVLLFVFQLSAFGQTVNETESRIILNENTAELSLVVESVQDVSSILNLEIVKPDGGIIARQSSPQSFSSGNSKLNFRFELSREDAGSADFIWYRLRYSIENGSSGVISLSSILPETFDLKIFSLRPGSDNSTNSVRVSVFNPVNDGGVSDVSISGKIELEDKTFAITETTTDKDGLAILTFSIPSLKESDDFDVIVTATKNGFSRTAEDRLSIEKYNFAYIQTDKSLYQPNQDVKLRLTQINFLKKTIPNEKLTIKISERDKGEKLFEETVKTSRFGIASIIWKIPESVKLGMYRIDVLDAEDRVIGLEEIKISRYEMPNFFVEAKPSKSFYLTDETTANVEIKGKYLFGKPMTRASVRVVSSTDGGSEDMVAGITGEVNAQGIFLASLDISKFQKEFEPRPSEQFNDISYTAYITDLDTNRTESRRFDIRITKSPIHVYLIEETRNQSEKLPAKFFVSTFYADGTPATCDVKFYRRIEKDADGKEIPTEIADLIAETSTNSFGGGKLSFLHDGDDLDLRIVAEDKKSNLGSIDKDIEFSSEPRIQVETDKTLYRRGEPVKLSILSTESNQKVLIDIAKAKGIIRTFQTKLVDGKAEITIPYDSKFINEVMFAAYFENDKESIVSDPKVVFYPTPNNLKIEANVAKTEFRPGENVSVQLRSSLEKEIAYGVSVLDQAIEERSRNEADFDRQNQSLNRKFYSSFTHLLGLEKGFGGFSVNDLKNLDMSKPISDDLQLAIEISLRDSISYELESERSRSLHSEVEAAFTPFFAKAVSPISDILNQTFAETNNFPRNEQSLREILLSKKIDFSQMRDAWESPYQTEFKTIDDKLFFEIWSFGADKLPKTYDDLSVLKMSWQYFQPIGKLIDTAMSNYKQRTDNYVTNYQILKDELKPKGIDLDSLRDANNKPFKFEFTAERTYFVLTIKSEDGKVVFWRNQADFFSVTRSNIVLALNRYVLEKRMFPQTQSEFKNVLKEVNFDIDKLKDISGFEYYIEKKASTQFVDRIKAIDGFMKSVRQVITTYSVRGKGRDGIQGNFDDYELLSFTGASSEQEYETSRTQRPIKKNQVPNEEGAIGGVVFDQMGAVIPETAIVAKNIESLITYKTVSNDSGDYLFRNLPKGIYEIRFTGLGFKILTITNVLIEPKTFYQIDAELQVGTVNSMVEITSVSESIINTSSASFSSNISITNLTAKEKLTFTPKLRQYFPETLVWSPELVSDKNGGATINFKFADTITNWKFYAVGSTEDGDFGLVEKDLQTYQPFFIELDPPRNLTEGDEISLPVQVRNYTEKPLTAKVSMVENDWSKTLDQNSKKIQIDSNSTANPTFKFKAISPVIDGKQQVIASAKNEKDAIEKPVTVRPNGHEVKENQSVIFTKDTSFEMNFPQNAFEKGLSAELKIYPNLLSHVGESVDGLLMRPYGCGEQTTSSTYPNLLILKVDKTLNNVSSIVKTKAQANLEDGYKRLLNYQTTGGFGIWTGDSPDVALTAYVLRFLNDAEEFIEVDQNVVDKATSWLLKQQKADGSFGNDSKTNAYILRALSYSQNADIKSTFAKTLEFAKMNSAKEDDAYILANYGLALVDSGQSEIANKIAEKLSKMSLRSIKGENWSTKSTAYNGWGNTGDIETTALVIQLFAKTKTFSDKASKGLSFLLQNKDEHGVWYSTQTTVNVLDALVLAQIDLKDRSKDFDFDIYVNGKKIRSLKGVGNQNNPLSVDLLAFLTDNKNNIEIKSTSLFSLVKSDSAYYEDWSGAKNLESEYLDLKIAFDKTTANIGETIACNVGISRKKYLGYGMLLAEIGIPPGSDVDRNSLELAKKSSQISSYEILPDRIVVYFSAGSNETKFSFRFKVRYGIDAQATASKVYDYYNPDAQVIVSPLRFVVK